MFVWSDFLLFLLAAVGSPGPNTMMCMANANRVGLRRAYPFTLGVGCGIAVLMTAVAFFCKTLSTLLPQILPCIKILGSIYILYLAYKLLTSSIAMISSGIQIGFATGFFLQFVNPKLILFGIVIMQTYIIPYFKEPLALVFFALFVALFCSLMNVLWTLAGALLKQRISEYSRAVNIILAILLVYCVVKLYITV